MSTKCSTCYYGYISIPRLYPCSACFGDTTKPMHTSLAKWGEPREIIGKTVSINIMDDLIEEEPKEMKQVYECLVVYRDEDGEIKSFNGTGASANVFTVVANSVEEAKTNVLLKYGVMIAENLHDPITAEVLVRPFVG